MLICAGKVINMRQLDEAITSINGWYMERGLFAMVNSPYGLIYTSNSGNIRFLLGVLFFFGCGGEKRCLQTVNIFHVFKAPHSFKNYILQSFFAWIVLQLVLQLEISFSPFSPP